MLLGSVIKRPQRIVARKGIQYPKRLSTVFALCLSSEFVHIKTPPYGDSIIIRKWAVCNKKYLPEGEVFLSFLCLFRKETGQTVTEFVNERRMRTGAHLLRTTRLQVQTIAQHCGVSDVNYFSKLFKKQYGVTPKQFREEGESPLKRK